MTIRELIATLSTVEDLDSLVVLISESGEGFSILDDVLLGSWSNGDFIDTDEPVGTPAVCLWPEN